MLTDNNPDVKEIKGLSGIIELNVLCELKDLFMTTNGVKKIEKYSCGAKEAKVWRVLVNIKREMVILSPGDKTGIVKVAERQAVTILLFGEQTLEGCCRVPPNPSVSGGHTQTESSLGSSGHQCAC